MMELFVILFMFSISSGLVFNLTENVSGLLSVLVIFCWIYMVFIFCFYME